jgi:hypothetical protein
MPNPPSSIPIVSPAERGEPWFHKHKHKMAVLIMHQRYGTPDLFFVFVPRMSLSLD